MVPESPDLSAGHICACMHTYKQKPEHLSLSCALLGSDKGTVNILSSQEYNRLLIRRQKSNAHTWPSIGQLFTDCLLGTRCWETRVGKRQIQAPYTSAGRSESIQSTGIAEVIPMKEGRRSGRSVREGLCRAAVVG